MGKWPKKESAGAGRRAEQANEDSRGPIKALLMCETGDTIMQSRL